MSGEDQFNQLQDRTGLSKTAVSHHLTILSGVGLIIQHARGSYRISEDGCKLLTQILDAYTTTSWKRVKEAENRAELIHKIYGGQGKLEDLEVKIVKLPRVRVAVFTSISETPEYDAFKALGVWTAQKGIDDLEKNPVLGFERPDLYQGQKRAYTFWVKVPNNIKEEKNIEIQEIPGSTYATTICSIHGDPWKVIPTTWNRLDQWVKDKGYDQVGTPCLERHLTSSLKDDFTLELYYPIKS